MTQAQHSDQEARWNGTDGSMRSRYRLTEKGEAMDAFEQLVASILSSDGYWTRTEYKVEITREEKRKIGRPSSPRWELDVIAYRPSDNELLVVECKSYLDSTGVRAEAFLNPESRFRNRFKLFNEETTREVVLGRLVRQLVDSKLCLACPTVRLCLAAAKVRNSHDLEQIESHFDEMGWRLYGPDWLKARVEKVALRGYENSTAAVVAKLLIR